MLGLCGVLMLAAVLVGPTQWRGVAEKAASLTASAPVGDADVVGEHAGADLGLESGVNGTNAKVQARSRPQGPKKRWVMKSKWVMVAKWVMKMVPAKSKGKASRTRQVKASALTDAEKAKYMEWNADIFVPEDGAVDEV